MLFMKKKYFEAIRAGRKTMTIRYWRRRLVRPGQVCRVRGLGRLRIESIEQVNLADLTDEHAAAEGFDSVARLRQELLGLYPVLADEAPGERQLFAIRFTYLPEPGERGTR